jgi:NAD(P)-dependent dehydrogenase (short-subunit alcohol dehydrogenase family)
MAERRVAIVTGVSSGIGESIARELAKDGYRVFGSVRSESGAVPEGVERLVLDVRDDASVLGPWAAFSLSRAASTRS